jgi:ATP-dependent helicase HrpA
MNDPRVAEIRQLLPQAMLPDWVRLGGRMVRLLRDQHHPQTHEKLLQRIYEQVLASVALRLERQANVPQVAYPPELPVATRRDDIVAAIRAHQVVIIAGETGSGKTTQIPKMCLEAGLGINAKIGCTQPRRVAALSISRRIAEKLQVNWGREVGCKIRFDDRSSPETYIKLMTDGILLAETQGDPLLSEYNCLILDEAHERSLNIDFLLGYLKGLLAKRSDLKLIITSATIDTGTFSRAFNDAPIIEVSGRLYPVEVYYAPLDEASEEAGDQTYVDAAVRATEQVLADSRFGNVLIFMPGERDIRETCDLLEGRYSREAEIIPLFGLLSAGEQQRVFAPGDRRKIIVATNIAETSLTIPGIRYVIDSGLARISRYNPRTRTKRLPVEKISQSSANQRKGRAGRVQDGVCIRLYSEEDFNERPAYTQPEIQRANLAEVILRMQAFRLGDIATFPFVNPPPPAAIEGGYRLLQELGALDDQRQLTSLGENLSRLPIDPTLGRMLLQSQQEHATHELLIIAAGLSIQDPRERPLDKKEAATAAHQRFADPQSDFLSLLKIWESVHDEWERLRTQNQRRKFCRANFLSYLRMREWQDLYAQLHGALEELGRFKLNEHTADYAAIHRSILTGLLAHVALRKERNVYQGVGNRQLALFPGSALFDRNDKSRKPRPDHGGRPVVPVPQPPWIVAGEIVETSQLFARTVAGIDPLWIVQLAPHLCQTTHHNPHWSVTAGNVLVEEKTLFFGLEIRKVKVAYGNLNAAEATEIFIRSALVEEDLLPTQQKVADEDNDHDDTRIFTHTGKQAALPAQYAFLEHNRKVRQKIETWQTRVRRHDLGNLDEKLFEFYLLKLGHVSSLPELNRHIREHGGATSLHATEADLTGGTALDFDHDAFPDAVPLGGQPVALTYAYSPGEEQDGVTVKLGFSLAQTVSQSCVEWSVPGLREGLVTELLRALPKSIRRELQPFPPKVAEIVNELQPAGESLQEDIAAFIRRRYGITIPVDAWPLNAIPAHLRPRIEVVGNDRKIIGSSRDLAALRQHLEQVKAKPAPDDSAWARVAKQWERPNITTWNFGDLPDRITVTELGPVPVYAWPGLALEKIPTALGQAGGERVSLRLFRTEAIAKQTSLGGLQKLIELALSKDFAWWHRDLRDLHRFDPLIGNLCSPEELQTSAYENLRRHVLPTETFWPLTEAQFNRAVQQTRLEIPGLCPKLVDQVGLILRARREIEQRIGPAPVLPATKPRTLSDLSQLNLATKDAPRATNPWADELSALVPRDFLASVPLAQLAQLPRYLKALATRMERAKLNPVKDKERAQFVAPYQARWKSLQDKPPGTPAAKQRAEEFRWMVEEYKVSVFAQELGTAFPVSPKRLEEHWQTILTAA